MLSCCLKRFNCYEIVHAVISYDAIVNDTLVDEVSFLGLIHKWRHTFSVGRVAYSGTFEVEYYSYASNSSIRVEADQCSQVDMRVL